MNIYQSYIYFENASTSTTKANQHHLNFYTYLHSYILLKKLYGSVSIVCNKNALKLFIQYIPYDNITIIEPSQVKNHRNFWSLLKVNSYKSMKTPFIHVDGDVLVFKNVFEKFIKGNYDVLTQSIEPINNNVYKKHGLSIKNRNTGFSQYNDSYDKSFQTLKDNGFLLLPKLDYAYNCGVFGIKNEKIKNDYIDTVNQVGGIMNKRQNNCNGYYASFIEQYILTDFIIKGNLKHTEVFDEHALLQKGMEHVAKQIGFTHFWCDSKFNKSYIDLIKTSIKNKYPDYIQYIENFESINPLL